MQITSLLSFILIAQLRSSTWHMDEDSSDKPTGKATSIVQSVYSILKPKFLQKRRNEMTIEGSER